MRKRLLLSASLSVIALGCFAAVGDNFTVNGVKYKVTSATEVAVNGAESTVTALEVPSSVSYENVDYTVTSVADYAFKYAKITSAELPSSVTAIGYQSFYNLPKLTSVSLGSGIKTIGDFAFGYLGATSLSLPEGLESIGNSAFFCAKVADINFPSTLKEIGPSCFYKAPLTKAILPAGLQTLSKKAFLECNQLAEVTIPDGITAIGDGTFFNTAITSVTLPSKLISIGEEAFYKTKLTEITIPASVQSIAGGAFSETNITAYKVEPGSKSFSVIDGILYNADQTILVGMPAKSSITELTLPSNCLGIGASAFYGSGIQSVTVSNKFRAIDAFAFCKSQLSQINMPESLVYIGEQAFAGTNLAEVVLPKALPQLPAAVFAECKQLKSVTIPASLNYMDIRVFFGCTALATVNCYGMTPPELETVYETGEEQFFQCPSTMVLNVPAGAKAAYTASDWKSYFSGRIYETLAGSICHTSASPADNSEIASFDGVTLTYPEAVTVVQRNPSIKVIQGELVAGVPIGTTISVDDWYATAKPNNQALIFPADYDGYTSPVRMEKGKTYFVIVPAGVFKNVAGSLNEAFTLQYQGAYEAPRVILESVTPSDNSTDVAEISTLTFNFAASVTLKESKMSSIKVTKNSPTGPSISVDQWWAVNAVKKGTSISLFAGDYDGYTCPIKLEAGTDYYVTIPAGLFALTSSLSTVNEEIVLHYRNEDTTAVNEIGVNDSEAEIYNLQGVRVDQTTPGRLYIKCQNGKTIKFLAK